jgi:hypothetical protein
MPCRPAYKRPQAHGLRGLLPSTRSVGMPEPAKLFYSYAHEDKTMRQTLGNHLQALRRSGGCVDWYDGEILGGKKWDVEIKEKLQSADFILLLISSDFLASDYINSTEMEIALRRADANEATIIPIMVRECSIKRLPFERFQGYPTDMLAVTSWPNQDAAWADVARGIERTVEAFLAQKAAGGAAPGGAVDSRAALAPETNRALAASSTRAFQRLREMMANPVVKEIVAEHQPQLESAGAALQLLMDYKDVHDLLHDLQLKCYNYLLQETRRTERWIDWEILARPQQDLAALAGRAAELKQLDSMKGAPFGWVSELVQAREAFDRAAATRKLSPLKEARDLIRPILELQPTRFDATLCEAARKLPLDELEIALAEIAGKLSPKVLESPGGAAFSTGVASLPELSANLQTLTTEHGRWQKIANDFWRISALIDTDLDELLTSWPRLKIRLGQVCGSAEQPWSVELCQTTEKLGGLVASEPGPEAPDAEEAHRLWVAQVRQNYERCATNGGNRFYQVDFSLKRLCDQLRTVADALTQILHELP